MIHIFVFILVNVYFIYSCNSLITNNFLRNNRNANSYLRTNTNKKLDNIVPNQNIIVRNIQNQIDIDSNNWELKLNSPCKLNLFLRILGRRPNGFRKIYV